MKVDFQGFCYNHTPKRFTIIPFGVRQSAYSSLVKGGLNGGEADICSRKQNAINT